MESNIQSYTHSEKTKQSILDLFELYKNQKTTTIRDSDKASPMILSFKNNGIIDSVSSEDDFKISGYVYNARNNTKLVGADVTIQIIRDDYVIRELSQKTKSAGTVSFNFRNIDYPEFHPTLCYDVDVTVNYQGNEIVLSDDFLMKNKLGGSVWTHDMEWLDIQKWYYLPDSFRTDIRETIRADKTCNNQNNTPIDEPPITA